VGKEKQEPDVKTIPAEDREHSSDGCGAAPAADANAPIAAVSAERDRLAVEKAELQDLVRRRQADFENFRKRAERDRSEFVQFAGMEFIREMLPVLDDFERAMKVESTDSNYVKGIQLIYTRLYDALKKMGLEPMETAGTPFDPNLHQAIERVETDEADDQTILGEFQKGYNFRGKLLRPAMVRVAVRPS